MKYNQYLAIMRNLYTGLQAEALLRYSKAGILEDIENEKRVLSIKNGSQNAAMLGISNIKDAFLIPSAIVECATWEITEGNDTLFAVCRGCKIAALCKKMEAPSPCNLYCLNPIEGMIKALNDKIDFKVESTLWDSDNCVVKVTQ